MIFYFISCAASGPRQGDLFSIPDFLSDFLKEILKGEHCTRGSAGLRAAARLFLSSLAWLGRGMILSFMICRNAGRGMISYFIPDDEIKIYLPRDTG